MLYLKQLSKAGRDSFDLGQGGNSRLFAEAKERDEDEPTDGAATES